MSKPTAIAVQTFRVPAQRVYDAVIDPDMIARFMFGPLLREETILHVRADARVGGRFSYKVRRDETEIDHVGKFLELDRPKRVVFTWAIAGEGEDDPSIVAIDITPRPDGCSLRLTHEMDEKWAAFIDRSRAGWEKMFSVLATLL
jgi:uncharacterized protein YndB with AHSA1/START domain